MFGLNVGLQEMDFFVGNAYELIKPMNTFDTLLIGWSEEVVFMYCNFLKLENRVVAIIKYQQMNNSIQ